MLSLLKTGAMAPIRKPRAHTNLSKMLASSSSNSRAFSDNKKRSSSPGRSPSIKAAEPSSARGKIDIEEL